MNYFDIRLAEQWHSEIRKITILVCAKNIKEAYAQAFAWMRKQTAEYGKLTILNGIVVCENLNASYAIERIKETSADQFLQDNLTNFPCAHDMLINGEKLMQSIAASVGEVVGS